MAATSNNKYDVAKWIKKVYDSCKTVEQFHNATKLRQRIGKVYDLYNDAGNGIYSDLFHHEKMTLRRLEK